MSAWISLVAGKFMSGFHPLQPFGSLDVHLRRQLFRLIERPALNIYHAG